MGGNPTRWAHLMSHPEDIIEMFQPIMPVVAESAYDE